MTERVRKSISIRMMLMEMGFKMRDLIRKSFSCLRHSRTAPTAPWQKREMVATMAKEMKAFNGNQSVVLLDIGSSGAQQPYWKCLLDRDLLYIIAVDMADDWSKKKSRQPANLIKIKTALGEENGRRTAYITRHPACSSVLKPNAEVLKHYAVNKWFDVIHEVETEIRRYDDLAKEKSLPQPDIAKIDVQGFEAQVINGMGNVLDNLLGLEFECPLKQFYIGQDTFLVLYEKMNRKGFILRDLRPQGPFEDEAVEFNTFWARKPRNERENRIIRLWEAATEVWSADDFGKVDAQQRAAFFFNE